MVVEHGECPRPRSCGELGFAAGRGIDVLTVNDPWAKDVENTKGQDRIVTADKMDEGQGSTEKVEKTSELQEALDGQPTWSSALGTAHRCRRPASRRLLVGPSSVGGPRASVSSRSTVRMRSPTFRWSEARLGAWSAARSWSSWRSTCRQGDKVPGDRTPPRAGIRGGRGDNSSRRGCGGGRACCWRGQVAGAEATQDAMDKAALAQLRTQWSRPPGLSATRMVDMGVQTSLVSDLSTQASKPVQQVVVTKNLEEEVVRNDKPLVGHALPVVKGTRSRSIRRSCGLFGGLSRVPHKETIAERGQREKEEREKRLTQREKREKEKKERNDELVSNLKVECWELYRCTREWARKSDKFDSVKRRADFDQEIARKSAIGWCWVTPRRT